MRTEAGFVDLQVNGGWGHDFTADPASIWEVGRRLPATGVTAFLPTLVSAPYQVADAAIAVMQDGPPAGYLGADPIGLHIEGPWISPDWRGAHNPQHLRLPDPEVARRWAESGVVRMVTMAPELEGAFTVAESLAAEGVVVSAGHSGASFEIGAEALSGPWSWVTHLFNQMTPFHHRSPGLVGAALVSDRPCGLIVDGIHSDPAAVRLAWTQLGPERLVLVTDAMAAMGLPPGRYRLGDQDVDVGPEGPRIQHDTLAGSTLTLDRAISNLIEWTDAARDQAVAAATTIPAEVIGIMATDGRVTLDDRLEVVETTIGEQVAYRGEAG